MRIIPRGYGILLLIVSLLAPPVLSAQDVKKPVPAKKQDGRKTASSRRKASAKKVETSTPPPVAETGTVAASTVGKMKQIQNSLTDKVRLLFRKYGVKNARLSATYKKSGSARFVGAYLLNESFHAMEEGDPKRVLEAAKLLDDPEFWLSAVLYNSTDRTLRHAFGQRQAMETVLKTARRAAAAGPGVSPFSIKPMAVIKGNLRAALPLALAIPTYQALSGEADLKSLGTSTAAYFIAGGALDLVTFYSGRVGWLTWTVKNGVTMYFGEKLDDVFHGKPWNESFRRKDRPRPFLPQGPVQQ